MPTVIAYPAPPEIAESPDYSLRVGGKDVFVYHDPVASFAPFSMDGQLEVEVEVKFPFERVVIRPLNKGIKPTVTGNTIRFSLPKPMKLSVEIDSKIRQPLLIFASPLETDVPDANDPNVVHFEGGKVHTPGDITLTQGQTLYIAGGAVVRGAVHAHEAHHVTVRGRGILDASLKTHHQARRRHLHFAGCDDLFIEGIIITNSAGAWTLMPAGCDRVTIRNIHMVNSAGGDDGTDIVGCRDVTIEDSFYRTKDDCIAMKSFPYPHPKAEQGNHNVLVQRCVFWNAEWGNAIDIGYETRADAFNNITIRDCDIIRVEPERYGSGAALSIHNGDRATITNVLYQDIRIEDCREKLIDFKIQHSRYSKDEQRGHIRGVTLRNVRVIDGPFPVSILQGHESGHLVEDVTIENLLIHGQPIRNAMECRMVTERIKNLRFIVS